MKKTWSTIVVILMLISGMAGTVSAATPVYKNIGNVKVDDIQFAAKAAAAVNDIVAQGPWVDVRVPVGSDITSALNAALATGKAVRIEQPGTYLLSGAVDRHGSGDISIRAVPGVVLDARASTVPISIALGGSRGTGAALGADVSASAMAITSTLASSLAAGDIVLITSTDLFNSTRAYYYKGEMAEVASVSGTTITLRSALYDSYTASTTTVYKLTMPKVSVSGFKILRNSNHEGLRVEYSRDAELFGNNVRGARRAGIRVEYLYGGTISGNDATDAWYSGSTESYALAIDTVQSVRIFGNNLAGGRHGFAAGGWEPCRDMEVYGNTVDNYHGSGQYAFDLHGNTEYIDIHHNTIKNGLLVSGRNLKVENNEITAIDAPNGGVCLYREINSDYFYIRNNTIRALGPAATYVFYDRPAVSGLNVKVLDFSGNKGTSIHTGIKIVNGPGTSGNTIDFLNLRDNFIDSTYRAITMPASDSSAYMDVKRISILGGRYHSTGDTPISILLGTPGYNESIEINTNIVTAEPGSARGLELTNVGDVKITGGEIRHETGGYRNEITASGTVWLTNTSLVNWSSFGGLHVNAAEKVILANNKYTGCTGSISFTKVFSLTGGYGNIIGWATAAPTTGAHIAGDFYFSATSTGGILGWQCTADGTPGTWQAVYANAGTTFWGFCTGTASASLTRSFALLGTGLSSTCTFAPDPKTSPTVPTAGTISNLRIRMSTSTIGSGSLTFVAYVNGSPTALTCTVTNPATTCSNTTNTVSVAAGDYVWVQYATNAAETAADISATMLFK